jgi:hypothetical protein
MQSFNRKDAKNTNLNYHEGHEVHEEKNFFAISRFRVSYNISLESDADTDTNKRIGTTIWRILVAKHIP